MKKLIAFRVREHRRRLAIQGSEVPKYGYAAGVYTSRLHFCQRIQIENIFVVSQLDLEPRVKAKVYRFTYQSLSYSRPDNVVRARVAVSVLRVLSSNNNNSNSKRSNNFTCDIKWRKISDSCCSVNSLYCRRLRPLHLHFFIPFRIDFKFVRFIFQVFEYIYSRTFYLGIIKSNFHFCDIFRVEASLIGVDSLEKKNIRLNVEHFLRYRGT